MLFDLQIVGHHPGYIRHILHYWPDPNIALTVVVSPEFLQAHDDVVQTKSEAAVTWLPITLDELEWYEASRGMSLQLVWAEWQLFCRYAKKTKADHGLVMYIDRFQLPLALRLPMPCSISGIYFRPKFHYPRFESHRLAKGERLKALREQFLWHSALRHPRLKTLFSLDPFAVEPLQRLGGSACVSHLPDPVEIYSSSSVTISLKEILEIDPQRKVFLLFGVLGRRKGIYQVLAALKQLSTSDQAQVTLLLIGPLVEPEPIRAEIEAMKQETSVQIILQDQFVPDKQIQSYFELADVVLALYQQHVGMSAILVRAAAAGKPVLASDYGLMGLLTRQYKLGITVDSTQPNQIERAMGVILVEAVEQVVDSHQMELFACLNSCGQFAETLWEDLVREPR